MTSSISVRRARACQPDVPILLDSSEPSGTRRWPGTVTAEARWRAVMLPFTLGLASLLIIISILTPDAVAQQATGTPSVTVTPEPDAPRLKLEFTELNDSGISGTATLYEAGEQTIVELQLEDTGANHPAHIHAGTCDDIEPEPAFPLQNVRSDGLSTTVVDSSLGELIDGEFVIDLHLSPSELGILVVCTNIEGEPQPPDASGTPAATPTTTATATPTQAPATTAPTATPPQPTEPAAVTEAAVPTSPPTATPTQPPVTATATPTPTQPPATATATEEPQPGNVIDESTPPDDGTQDGTGGAVNESSDSASVPLTSTSELGVTGTAVLTRIDVDTTTISVVLSGDAVSGDAIVHLHDGTCDVAGEYTLDLNPIAESGISETEVDLSLEALIADGYFINVHQSEAAYDTWFVCGELTNATVGMVVPEVAPDTGASGTREATPTAIATAVPTPPTPPTTPATPDIAAGTGDGTQGGTVDPGKGVPIDETSALGDGTQGDLADSGKGAPIDPTTGLPITAGTGSSLQWPTSTDGPMPWMMMAMAIALFVAGIAIRISTSRPAGRTVPGRRSGSRTLSR